MNTRLIRVLVASLALMWIGFAGARSKDVTLTYLEGQVVTTIDPAKHTDESSHHAIINMFDPLLCPKVPEGSMEPGPHRPQPCFERTGDGGRRSGVGTEETARNSRVLSGARRARRPLRK